MMKNISKERCDNCLYFIDRHRSIQSGNSVFINETGQCRFNIPEKTSYNTRSGHYENIYTSTVKHGWCGKYTTKNNQTYL